MGGRLVPPQRHRAVGVGGHALRHGAPSSRNQRLIGHSSAWAGCVLWLRAPVRADNGEQLRGDL